MNQEPKFWVDLKRPDFFCEEDRALWRKIHQHVEEMGERIVRNGSFAGIQSMLNAGESYGGGGFSYKFWFDGAGDMDEFLQRLSSLMPPHVIAHLEVHR